MGSEDRLCGWQFPRLEKNKVVQRPLKAKSHQAAMDPLKYKTLSLKEDSFQHFSDSAMYINNYRQKHTIENTGKACRTENMFPKTELTHYSDPQLSNYIDIRLVG